MLRESVVSMSRWRACGRSQRLSDQRRTLERDARFTATHSFGSTYLGSVVIVLNEPLTSAALTKLRSVGRYHGPSPTHGWQRYRGLPEVGLPGMVRPPASLPVWKPGCDGVVGDRLCPRPFDCCGGRLVLRGAAPRPSRLSAA